MTPNPLFGVFRLDSAQRPVADALLVGPESSLFAHIPGSLSREHLADTAQGLRQFVTEHQQHAARLQKYEEQLAHTRADLRQFIDDVCESLSGLKAERDAEARRANAEQRRIDAEEASREELNAALGALPAESLGPDLPAQDPAEYPDRGQYPDDSPDDEVKHTECADDDDPDTPMPDHPAELAQLAGA